MGTAEQRAFAKPFKTTCAKAKQNALRKTEQKAYPDANLSQSLPRHLRKSQAESLGKKPSRKPSQSLPRQPVRKPKPSQTPTLRKAKAKQKAYGTAEQRAFAKPTKTTCAKAKQNVNPSQSLPRHLRKSQAESLRKSRALLRKAYQDNLRESQSLPRSQPLRHPLSIIIKERN